MTPREQFFAALRRERPEGLVPHLELEFQLAEEAFGEPLLNGALLEGKTGSKRQDMLKHNAELLVKCAETYKYCTLVGTHWLPMEDQQATFGYLRELAGDTYAFNAFVDGTFSIPSGSQMMDFVTWIADRPEEVHETAERQTEAAINNAKALREAGAEVVFMCADYCFNDGPFLSPNMFREFVTPYLTRQITSMKDMGFYVVKHTDGDIMPIIDQLVEAGPHALHSLDPMAGVDIKKVKELYGDQVALIGNVNCAWVQDGSPEQIRQSSLYCLKYGGVAQGGYVFATSNCIFKGVPLANYDVMLQVRNEFGYPDAEIYLD